MDDSQLEAMRKSVLNRYGVGMSERMIPFNLEDVDFWQCIFGAYESATHSNSSDVGDRSTAFQGSLHAFAQVEPKSWHSRGILDMYDTINRRIIVLVSHLSGRYFGTDKRDTK